MHDIYSYFDDLELDLDFENVCKACPACSVLCKRQAQVTVIIVVKTAPG